MLNAGIIGEWMLDQTKIIEFFDKEFTKVHFTSMSSPKLQNILNELDDGKDMAFSFVNKKGSILFYQFYSTIGCLIIKNNNVNNQNSSALVEFLKKHKFFTKNKHDLELLEKLTGESFSNIKSFQYVNLKFCQNKKPIIQYFDHDKIECQIALLANEVAIYHDSIPKYREFEDVKNKLKDFDEKTLIDNKIALQLYCNLNQKIKIEFFKNQFTTVQLIQSNNPNINKILQKINDNNPMALDLEWNPYQPKKVDLFQICSSKGALIIKNVDNSEVLKSFLQEHSFVMKDMSNDKKMLSQTFGKKFNLGNVDDIAVTVLRKNKLDENFGMMVKRFADAEPTAEFKKKSVTKSDWSGMITNEMLIYAAYDVVALYKCMPNFSKKEYIEKSIPPI